MKDHYVTNVLMDLDRKFNGQRNGYVPLGLVGKVTSYQPPYVETKAVKVFVGILIVAGFALLTLALIYMAIHYPERF